jgi:hypothetical protein
VLEAMRPYFSEKFGNPASRNHFFGWQAAEEVEAARKAIAGAINAEVEEIVFTSGGTESDNLAIKGAARASRKQGKDHIVTAATEHKAGVLTAYELLGFVFATGKVDDRKLEIAQWRIGGPRDDDIDHVKPGDIPTMHRALGAYLSRRDQVQQAIRMVFTKLGEFGSVRQVLMWLRDEDLSLPTLESERPRAITWRRPTYRMVLSIVRSPFYAGAYAFGRRESRTRVVDGRATRTPGHEKPMDRWTALIRDHHPGYIPWEHFERNQRLLEENAHMKGTIARKAGRGGRCLLAGLLRCARCGRCGSTRATSARSRRRCGRCWTRPAVRTYRSSPPVIWTNTASRSYSRAALRSTRSG